ncbi:MAG: hypothetical protein EPO52_10850 [Herbiconiux sp.]|uniref:DUF4190 domain-containing protein n=1 Tax=Herbiconiux sp. TaxID=1871186 RepID=UPI0012035B77|nr:DUF4190 domain-containing protein [Herbiconiux sp.]TAJ48604.1 MAG: hypothetical protein EPO52_10850 [Herbiconiux sp.]
MSEQPPPPSGGAPPQAAPPPPYPAQHPPYPPQPPYPPNPQHTLGGGPVAPPPGADYPGKTLGVVGLIVAIFANVIGIVISAIALDQSKRAGFRNGPAKAGVIVGSVLLGAGLLIGLVFAVVGIAIGLTAALTVPFTGGQSAPSTAAPTPMPSAPAPYLGPGPSEPALPGETFGGQSIEYAVGDCFMEPTADYGHVQFVDCAAPHDYEVYADFTVPDTTDGSYPGVDRMSLAADSGCRDAYADFTGVPWEASVYDYQFVAPDDYTWASFDDRTISCVISDPSGPTTGTLRSVGR